MAFEKGTSFEKIMLLGKDHINMLLGGGICQENNE